MIICRIFLDIQKIQKGFLKTIQHTGLLSALIKHSSNQACYAELCYFQTTVKGIGQ